MHLAPVEMGVHVWMKRMAFIASVLRGLSRLTATPRWTSVAAALVSMAHAGMTSMGTAVTVSLDGSGRTVTLIEMIVYQVPARMLVHALTSSTASPASVVKVLEVTSARSTSTSVPQVPV